MRLIVPAVAGLLSLACLSVLADVATAANNVSSNFGPVPHVPISHVPVTPGPVFHSPVSNHSPELNPSANDYLPSVAQMTLAIHFGHSDKQYASVKEFADSLPVPAKYQKTAGMFVTFSRKGKTRACWGSVNPQYPDLVKGTVYATEAALTKEYRFHKVRASEWNTLKPQVTIIKTIQPIISLEGQDPLAYGLLVRAGGKGAILLPGEASDATYQLIQCKVKAGLDPNKPCQMYRVVANVFN